MFNASLTLSIPFHFFDGSDEDADNSPTGFGDVFGGSEDEDEDMSDEEEMVRRGLLGLGEDEDDVIEEEEESEMPMGAGGSEAKSPGSDFGGDYGDYLKLLEGKSALGFNPQSDPVADNQVNEIN